MRKVNWLVLVLVVVEFGWLWQTKKIEPIIGLVKKNFVNFKKVLKVWGYFWLAFAVLLIVKFITTFISSL
jgi:hypothetical protein